MALVDEDTSKHLCVFDELIGSVQGAAARTAAPLGYIILKGSFRFTEQFTESLKDFRAGFKKFKEVEENNMNYSRL